MKKISRTSPANLKVRRTTRVTRLLGAPVLAIALAGFAASSQAIVFLQTNLVTDDQSVNAAQITDTSLKNAWGITYNGTGSPFWVSDNATGLATLYNVNGATNVTTKNVAVIETIPPDGSITGQAFSNAGVTNFSGANFIFVSENGVISGRIANNNTATVLVPASPDNVYKGTAFANIGGNGYLYSANFKAGTIDVLKGTAAAPNLAGNFSDPNLPPGYAPFNVAVLNGKVYVTYAVQDGAKHDDVTGAGNGIVNVFDLQGNFLARVASGGTLNSPWGLAIAPASFGQFAGDLLVGNFGDGMIGAYDVLTDTFQGLLPGANGNPIQIDGLWGLIVGTGGNSGSPDKIYFSAGPNDEANGLFGVLFVPEPASLALLGIGLAGLGFSRRQRS